MVQNEKRQNDEKGTTKERTNKRRTLSHDQRLVNCKKANDSFFNKKQIVFRDKSSQLGAKKKIIGLLKSAIAHIHDLKLAHLVRDFFFFFEGREGK